MAKLIATRFRVVRQVNDRAILTFGNSVRTLDVEVIAAALPGISEKISEAAQGRSTATPPMQKLPAPDHALERPISPSEAQYSFEAFPETGKVLAKYILPATESQPHTVLEMMIGLQDVQKMIDLLSKAAAMLKMPTGPKQ